MVVIYVLGMKQFIATEMWYNGRVSEDSGGGRRSMVLNDCGENVYVVVSEILCSVS